MTNELTKIIVKIGDKSNVKFSHCKTYRAIMASELKELTKANEDCNIVIIESISENEQNEVRDFAFEFNNIDDKHNVFFFIPNSRDVITSGIADELDYNIYLTLDDLYKAIYDKYNINVSVFLSDKQKYNSIVSEDTLGIDSMPSLDLMNEVRSDNTDAEKQVQTEEIKVDDTKTTELEDNNTAKPKLSLSKNEVKDVEEVKISEGDSEELRTLRIKYNDLCYDYKQAVKDIKDSTDLADKLKKTLDIIKEERDITVKRFNQLVMDNDVIEDPITLTVYSSLKEEITAKDNIISELESTIDALKASIEKYKDQNKTLNDNLASKISSIEELENTTKDLNNVITELRAKIDSGELLQGTIDEYSFRIKELETFISELQANEEILKTRIKDEASARLSTLEYSRKALLKMAEAETSIEELEIALVYSNEKVAEIRDQLEEASERVENLTIDNQNHLVTIANTQKDLEDATKRMGLADTYSAQEKNQLLDKMKDMQSSINSLKEQLSLKETQYRDLVEHSKSSSTESVVLVNTNKNLDAMNRQLRDKLDAANKELGYLRKFREDANTTLQQYKQSNTRLQSMLDAFNANDPSTLNGVNRIGYNESAQIITVFGSGSYGTTTTAVSLAHKLSTSSKVLFIDFDTVSPKADAWFNKLPFCNRVKLMNPGDIKNTGLGIFYEVGVNEFCKYFNGIVEQCNRTKGGGIDYLSGAYYRVDKDKMSKADYASFFNFLGARYQYIVIDMGRLGNNIVTDGLIREVSNISRFNVVVTLGDRIEIRNLNLRLQDARINTNRLAWLLNMCDTTAIDDKTRQNLGNHPYGIMIKDTSLLGVRGTFLTNKMNKDKLDAFINTVFR